MMSASPLTADISEPRRHFRVVPRPGCDNISFYHLVGEQLHRAWDRQSERLGGLQIDDQLELDRTLDRKIGRLVALENPPGIDARSAKRIRNVVTVTHQAAVGGILAKSINRRNRMARRERNDL